jgi:hypothetical protein
MTRELLISAKTQGIKTYFYTNKAAWQNMDTRHPGDVGTLTGARDKAWHRPKRKRGYMQSWVELMVLNDPERLSREADQMRYNLNYTYDRQSAIESLNNDMSNARKPDAGQERETAVKIITSMRQHGLNTIKDFVDHIAEKWQAINKG